MMQKIKWDFLTKQKLFSSLFSVLNQAQKNIIIFLESDFLKSIFEKGHIFPKEMEP